MIPQSLLGDAKALEKTLLRSREAMLRRLERTKDKRIGGLKWSVHEGKARSSNLPDVDAGVWLMLSDIMPDPESGIQADGFFGIWHVQFVIKDPGVDQYGFRQDAGFSFVGGVLRVITEELVDTGLDGAADDIEMMSAHQAIGVPSGGDREIAEWLVVLRVRHPLITHDH